MANKGCSRPPGIRSQGFKRHDCKCGWRFLVGLVWVQSRLDLGYLKLDRLWLTGLFCLWVSVVTEKQQRLF